MKNNYIYLDYAATTPVDREVLKAMQPYFSQKFGNAMSIHAFGREAEEAVDNSREILANFLHCQPNELIFTSGATEANNLVIKGVLKSYYAAKKGKPHIITTAFEHHCVLDACKVAEKDGLAEISYIRPDKDGLIKAADIKNAIKFNTILVSVMYVNNEIGTVQPIAEIGKIIADVNSKMPSAKRKIVFHTDATQALNYFDCDVEKLGIDLLSFSGHKIYGPKGVGALYIKRGTTIRRIMDGGDQEFSLRAGTQNVPGIVGLAEAVLQIKKSCFNNKKLLSLRDYLINKVLREIQDSQLNGSRNQRSPANANFSFKNVEGEGLLLALDLAGIAVSTGSACSTGALEPSHVLLAIGLKPEVAHGSLRITLGRATTKRDIDIFIRKLKTIVGHLRKVSGQVLKDFYGKN